MYIKQIEDLATGEKLFSLIHLTEREVGVIEQGLCSIPLNTPEKVTAYKLCERINLLIND